MFDFYQMSGAITPHWLGIGLKHKTFAHIIRRIWIRYCKADKQQKEIELHTNYVEYLGMFSNPELYRKIKENQEKKLVNPAFTKQLELLNNEPLPQQNNIEQKESEIQEENPLDIDEI